MIFVEPVELVEGVGDRIQKHATRTANGSQTHGVNTDEIRIKKKIGTFGSPQSHKISKRVSASVCRVCQTFMVHSPFIFRLPKSPSHHHTND